MTFSVLLALSGIVLWYLPVSLLPAIDVPRIVIKVQMPNTSPAELEQSVFRPMRETMLTVGNLREINSRANSESGQAELFFEYGTNMELAYIEVNEKIDQLTNRMPRGMTRPQVIRVNTSDVPVARLQIVGKGDVSMVALSNLAEFVIKKRLEGLEGASLVDINGLQRPAVFVMPLQEKLQALQIDEETIAGALRQNNQEVGAVSVRDGQYRYFMQLVSRLENAAQVERIAFNTPRGQVVRIKEVAVVKDSIQRPQGFHFFNDREAVVITLHKQAKAQMPELMKQFHAAVADLKQNYPDVDFHITQDQSILLDVSIGNLRNDLLFGGLFAFLVLFLFIGNYRIPFLIGVILPSSLLMSFLVFGVFGISINIISLAGLALGLGMTIDNAIIIFDHIGKKRLQGKNLLDSCVEGTTEMVPPLLSSALTTQAVFIPLVFLGGISGALAYDQAVAVGAILLTSLLVSFFLLPMLYMLLFRNTNTLPKEDNRLFTASLKVYKAGFHFVWKRRKVAFPFLLVLGLAGMSLALLLRVEGLPAIERRDLSLFINWNEAIDVAENARRTNQITQYFAKQRIISESDVGIRQFLLQTSPTTLQDTEIYFLTASEAEKNKLASALQSWLFTNYPNARVVVQDAPNTFDFVFSAQGTYLEAKLRNSNGLRPIPPANLLPEIEKMQQKFAELSPGEGTLQETQVRLLPNYDLMNSYQVNPLQVVAKIQNMLGDRPVTEIRRFGQMLPIQLYESAPTFQQKMSSAFLSLDSVRNYPLLRFIDYNFLTDYRSLTADKAGIYHSVAIDEPAQATTLMDYTENLARKQQWKVDFSGQHLENRENLLKLIFILCISVGLLYFILAIEFESFKMPLIVVFTLPLGFTGSLLMLWLFGESMNIMAAMGLVVMLGIIDNDSILKIDAINRLRKEMPLDQAIAKAGELTFKPILMTSLTNVLALLPFLFDSGLSADLQRPFALAIIGGLSIGTVTALYFVPLMYKFLIPEQQLESSQPESTEPIKMSVQ